MKAAIDRLSRRILGVVAWGRKTTSSDSGTVQTSQVMLNKDEILDDNPTIFHFGFTCHPPDGSDVAIMFAGGDRTKGVIVGTAHKDTRLKGLAQGESAIYDSLGKHIYLKSGEIEIDAKGQPVNIINASTVTVTASGNVTVNSGGVATISAPTITLKNTGSALKSLCTSVFMDLFNAHTHEGSHVPDQQAVDGTHTTNIVSAE